jgi:hypothetical protein
MQASNIEAAKDLLGRERNISCVVRKNGNGIFKSHN